MVNSQEKVVFQEKLFVTYVYYAIYGLKTFECNKVC